MSFSRQTRVLPLTHLAFNALNIDDDFLKKREEEKTLLLLFTILPSNYIWAGIPKEGRNESSLYREVIDKAVEETNTDKVAVGTPISRSPPHRSVRAELPHTAPTSSIWRQSVFQDDNALISPSE